MENPTRQRQLEELDQVELCTRILYQARNELYVNMHFLDVSLSSLGFEADWNRNGMACDGAVIYYGPGFLLGLYKKGRAVVNRYYLHTLFHCLFCHLYTRKGREKKMWDLACDIAMESVLDGMYEKCIHVLQSPLRREMYLRLRRFLTGNKNTGASNEEERKVVLTAERVYHALMEMELPKRRMEQLEAEFHVDDHDLWEQEPDPSAAMTRQNQWNDNRERMQTQMETMGAEEESENEQSLLDSIQVENEERYDYRQFLKKFAVLREEMQTDPDSFDQAFYTYGLSLYGNMPLIEPLETREVQRIQQFVIVIVISHSHLLRKSFFPLDAVLLLYSPGSEIFPLCIHSLFPHTLTEPSDHNSFAAVFLFRTCNPPFRRLLSGGTNNIKNNSHFHSFMVQ